MTDLLADDSKVWDAIVAYEDGDDATLARLLPTLDRAERAVFTEEAAIIEGKRAAAPPARAPRGAPSSPPVGPSFEEAILARQDFCGAY